MIDGLNHCLTKIESNLYQVSQQYNKFLFIDSEVLKSDLDLLNNLTVIHEISQVQLDHIKKLQQEINKLLNCERILNKTQEQNFIFATHNQYAEVYGKFHKDSSWKNSACTPISGHFVLETLQCGKVPESLDDVMEKGQKLMSQLMQKTPPQQGTHFEFEEVLKENAFGGLQQCDTTIKKMRNNPFICSLNLLEGEKAFEKIFHHLKECIEQEKLSCAGTVLTHLGASYAVVLFQDSKVVFFDSHGDRTLTSCNEAYVAQFKEIDSAIVFLKKKFSISEDSSDFEAIMQMTPVRYIESRSFINSNKNNEIYYKETNINLTNFDSDSLFIDKDVESLKDMIRMLGEGEEGFFNACSMIINLQNSMSVFSMTGQDPISIGDRLYFHMYSIHKNEEPNKLYFSLNYGSEAFQNNSTPLEKTRCAQRVFAELVLQRIEECISKEDTQVMRNYLKDLEGIVLNEKDFPNIQNLAHELFIQLYWRYLEARERNPQLVDPQHEAFKGDFGRVAFENTGNIAIDRSFKLDVIQALKQRLKEVWKI